MTEKECSHCEVDEERIRRRAAATVLAFVVALAFIVFLVWAILHPHSPRFVLQDATIYAFNLSGEPDHLGLITTNLQVTLSSRNPNDKIGVYYEKLDVYASYRNQQVTLATLLPPTYQGHLDMTVWSPFLTGDSVPVAPYLSPVLSQDLNMGKVLLSIKVDGWVKWKVGTWVSGRYRLHVSCPAYIAFHDRDFQAMHQTKYQLVQRCTVDV